jgi:ABC-type glycerol-3-phosphate transport system permease component
MAESAILFSHIIPPIMAVISVILICTGIMDKKNIYTLMGIILFFAAGIIPFLILPYMLN